MEAFFPKVTNDDNWARVLCQTGLYGYVLFVAANMIGDSAELLLLVPELTAMVGSIMLPILGAVPDGMMVLCSGLGPDAQTQVKVGVGALAGSTIMLLTVPWILSIASGRVSYNAQGRLNYNPPKGQPKLTVGCGLFEGGCKIEKTIKDNAKIMLLTSCSYLIIQIPAFTVDSKDKFVGEQSTKAIMARELPAAWLALVSTIGMFFWYIIKMYKAGTVPSGSVDDLFIKQAVIRIERGELSLKAAIQNMRDPQGQDAGMSEPLTGDVQVTTKKMLCPFFRHYDDNGDQKINFAEFRMLLKDVNAGLDEKQAAAKFKSKDKDNSGTLDFGEFVDLMVAFANEAETSSGIDTSNVARRPTAAFYLGDVEGGAAGGGDEAEEAEEEDMPEDLANLSPAEQQKRLKSRAFQGMFLGTALVLVFSDPMTDMLGFIAKKIDIDAFIVAFVVAPLASNAAELVSSMKIAAKKTPSAMTQSLSTLLGAAIMNNTFCLSIFMVLIVWKNLEWQFSAETMSILIIQVLIGGIVLKFDVQSMAHGVVIMLCYPVALVVVLGLEACGWD